jgi:hypothetical protein
VKIFSKTILMQLTVKKTMKWDRMALILIVSVGIIEMRYGHNLISYMIHQEYHFVEEEDR